MASSMAALVTLLLLQLSVAALEDLCHPNPCGLNTLCEVDNVGPFCKCQPGYLRSESGECRHECENSGECGPEMACVEFKCQNSCSQCGLNAECEDVQNHVPVCRCPKGYFGNPLSSCQPECTEDNDCPPGKPACFDNSCKNPCDGVCGFDADCDFINGTTPLCSCPEDMTGDPFMMCRPFTKEELCHPSTCGVNTLCEIVNNISTCKCEPGYYGNPIAECRHECENSGECMPEMACIEFKCQNSCSQCGLNAECEDVQNHVPVCKCPKGYLGNPLLSCHPECTQHRHCPPGKPACSYNSCKNPCDGVCGFAANCELRNGITPVCSCPRNMTGDPFVMCRPFTKKDLCEPNPCGANAKCQPGYDKKNRERPVCTCHDGYTGNPIEGCVGGECIDDNGCPDHQTCREHKCQNPCRSQCGVNAICNPRRHRPVCTCLSGYDGDPLFQCQKV